MTFAPTFIGFIPETHDALLLFQAVIEGRLNLVTSRPPENERANVIRSGAVYIFKEGTIKRWTDKVCWSPSRVLGNFLVYRELGSKRSRSSSHRPIDIDGSRSHDDLRRYGPTYQQPNRGRNVEFSLYGSLVDSYDFKPDGLVKKTISTTYDDETYRLISYYTVEDVQSHKLLSPMEYPALVNIEVDARLATGIQFQMPLNTIASNDYVYEEVEVGQDLRSQPTPCVQPALSQSQTVNQPSSDLHMMQPRLSLQNSLINPVYPIPFRSELSTGDNLEQDRVPQYIGYDLNYSIPTNRVNIQDQFSSNGIVYAPYDLPEQISYPMQDVQGMQSVHDMPNVPGVPNLQHIQLEEDETVSQIVPF